MSRRWSSLLLAFALIGVPGAAAAFSICGNNAVEFLEECDDGDAVASPGQACRANCRSTMCGKPTNSAGPRPNASDALFTLRSAVGSSQCASCVCDVNGIGGVSATDALAVLRAGVGQPIPLVCGSCFAITRKGRLNIRHRIEVPEEDREALLGLTKEIEAEGYTIGPEAAFVLSPVRGVRGWPVVFGDQRALTDINGDFEISVDQGDSSRGTVAHPQQAEEPIFAINLAHLAARGADVVPVEMTMTFAGPCGMHDEKELPDPPQCEEVAPPIEALVMHKAREASEASSEAGAHAHDHDSASSDGHAGHDHGAATSTTAPGGGGEAGIGDPVIGTTTGPLGIYPAGNQNCCRDYDGYIPSTTRGTYEHYIAYFGSTCKKRVDEFCCAGERGTVGAIVLDKLDIVRPKACYAVHHGRLCQELAPGDVAVNAAGTIVKKGQTMDVTVHLGSTSDVIVHNNGCFGETYQEKTEEQLFGVLTGPNLADGVIKHYQGVRGPYFTDRTLTYTLAPCVGSVEAGDHDTYEWSADAEGPTVNFVRSNVNLWKFEPSGPIFSYANPEGYVIAQMDQCDGTHVHGLHPCTGAAEPPGAGPCGHGKVSPVVVP